MTEFNDLSCLMWYHLGIREEYLDLSLKFLQIVLQFSIYISVVEILYKFAFFIMLYCVLQEDLLNFLVVNSNFYFNFGRVRSHLRGAFHYLKWVYLVLHSILYYAFICLPISWHGELHPERLRGCLFWIQVQTGIVHFIWRNFLDCVR